MKLEIENRLIGDRMQLRDIFFLAASAGALAGCHQPMTAPKPPTFQNVEITVQDWQNAAHDVTSELIKLGVVGSPTRDLRPIFVEVQKPDSTFLHEAADELEADILRRGGTIAPAQDNAIVVSLDVDVVQWTPGDLFPPGNTNSLLKFPANTEAVLKATIRIDHQLVRKFVEPVYVRDGDVALYQPPLHAVLPARLLRYDN